MSDTKPPAFGQVRSETKKNPKVFGLRVKIEPYTSVPADKKPRKDEKFDPFAVVIETPKE